jgi:hypothetical protein
MQKRISQEQEEVLKKTKLVLNSLMVCYFCEHQVTIAMAHLSYMPLSLKKICLLKTNLFYKIASNMSLCQNTSRVTQMIF